MDEFRKEILKEHNRTRIKFGCVPSLALEDSLNEKAQIYASHLAAEDTGLVHSNNRNLGENLFQFYSSDLKLCSAQLVVESFVNESNYYNFDNPKLSNVYSCGHFTQVVWKNSSLLGVGIALSDQGFWYIVCNYFPPGNIHGMYSNNVFKPSILH